MSASLATYFPLIGENHLLRLRFLSKKMSLLGIYLGKLFLKTSARSRSFKSSHTKAICNGRSHTSSSDQIGNEIWENDINKVEDLAAAQILQDLFSE